MSDAVALALIAMVHSWGDKFILNLAVIVPAVGTGLITLLTWYYNRKSAQRAEEAKAQLELVEERARRSKEEADLMAKGAERAGVEIGIQTERKRASDFGGLRQEYKPESTDVFMKRTEL